MRFLFPYLLKEKFWFLIATTFILGAALLTMVQAGIVANMISFALNLEKIPKKEKTSFSLEKTQTSQQKVKQKTNLKTIWTLYKEKGNIGVTKYLIDQKNIWLIAKVVLLCFFLVMLNQLFVFFRDFSSNYLSMLTTTRIREQLFSRMIYFPSSYFHHQSRGDLISKSLNDVLRLQECFYSFMEAALFGPTMVLVGFLVLVYLNMKMTFAILGFVLLLFFILYLLSLFLKKIVYKIQSNLSNISEYIQKIFFGIDIIKIFQREEYEKRKFKVLLKRHIASSRLERILTKLNTPFTEISGTLIVFGIIFYGANLIWKEEIVMEDIFQFVIMMIYVAPYIRKISSAILIHKEMTVYTERLEGILKQKVEKVNVKRYSKEFVNYKGNIEFKNIFYRYPNCNEWTLNDVSFSVKTGEFIAFVGPSGGGKTTLMKLIPALIQAQKGSILFDGLNTNKLSLAFIRSQTAYVSQDSILFNESIKKNIAYGNLSANFKEIVQAAKKAHIHDFILSQKKGYETIVGEGGVTLSGGQRQRLCIARAILKKPCILLLDEATSALDASSEKAVQKAMESLVKKQTIFVIAHRFSTIMNADKIFVIEKGKIIEQGSHQELSKKGALYQKLHKLQFYSS